ncbi:MAG: YeeE/YedE thiosulfate transporter family protein [bacterium]
MTDLPLIGSLDPIIQLYVLIFILSMVFGAVARKTEFCPLGGVADIIHSGQSGRFWMYFFTIGVAILGVTILGMGTAAVLMLYVEGFFNDYFLSWMMPLTPDLAAAGYDHQDLGTLAAGTLGGETSTWRIIIGGLIAAILIGLSFRAVDFRARTANIIGGLIIGLIIVGAFYLSGGPLGDMAQEASDFMETPQNGMGVQSYTFIRPMGDMLYVIANPVWTLVTFGLVAFLGVGAGSLLMSILTLQFRLQWFSSPVEAARYLVGGIMVGIGGILGMGCTLGQGVAGSSTLAAGSFLNLASLLLGAWIGIKLQSRFMQDHELPRGVQ